ncbi:MAG: GTP 3',8-cyclase MoaA [Acidimicrobiales bacterium]|nr:GTP 3',8-cyclase MoaA [Hyphomonadaceae bacterium]RZV41448.1 MAG: GTP 3',8-cyclase MoaA [Acidimicrobiales bacterium]
MKNLTDPFGRRVTYLRLSLTDRCDLRCFYCMAEKMQFLPRKDLLTLEELGQVADAFIARGVRKIRLTGGEPLVRKDFMNVINHLSAHLDAGRLDEIALTTNATQLARFAGPLKDAGVARVNVSLDSLDPHAFNRITRGGNITQVLDGIDAALDVGLKLKINTVALKNDNADDIPEMIEWAHGKGMDLSLIEVMPLGETGEDRFDQYIPLTEIRDKLEQKWALTDTPETTGGPSRYVDIKETGRRLGFISPLSHNFCASCNRVRVTCTGQLFMCLGQDDNADLRAALRGPDGVAALDPILDEAIGRKPEKHEFEIDRRRSAPAVARHMSVTGG